MPFWITCRETKIFSVSYELSSMDFLEFEVGTDVIGNVIEAAEVGSNTSLNGEVFIEAIAGTESHGLFGVVATDSSRDVELADVVRLEETVKSSLRSKALLHLVIELVNTGIDGCEVVLHFLVVVSNSLLVKSDSSVMTVEAVAVIRDRGFSLVETIAMILNSILSVGNILLVLINSKNILVDQILIGVNVVLEIVLRRFDLDLKISLCLIDLVIELLLGIVDLVRQLRLIGSDRSQG